MFWTSRRRRKSAAFSASGAPPRRRKSSTRASSPSSTAARNRPGLPSPPATTSKATPAWAGQPGLQSPDVARRTGRPRGDRARAVFDHRVEQTVQRPAVAAAIFDGTGRRRPQRQPDQRRGIAGRLRTARAHFPIDDRHRNHRPPAGQADPRREKRPAAARAETPAGGVQFAVFISRPDRSRPRPVGGSAAGARQDRHRASGASPARRARSTRSTPSTSARSSRARSSASTTTA